MVKIKFVTLTAMNFKITSFAKNNFVLYGSIFQSAECEILKKKSSSHRRDIIPISWLKQSNRN